jgi:hypothetical protein
MNQMIMHLPGLNREFRIQRFDEVNLLRRTQWRATQNENRGSDLRSLAPAVINAEGVHSRLPCVKAARGRGFRSGAHKVAQGRTRRHKAAQGNTREKFFRGRLEPKTQLAALIHGALKWKK